MNSLQENLRSEEKKGLPLRMINPQKKKCKVEKKKK
jgi:hypothetical protein